VLRQLIHGAQLDLYLRDWHLDNVGFSDEVNPKMILVDWEGNIPAGANLSPRDCIDYAFRCFSNSLCSPLRNCRDDNTGRSREVRANIDKWRECLTVLTERLLFWWTEMGKFGFTIPSDYSLTCLKDSLVMASKSALLLVNRDVRGGVQASLAEALEFITTDVSGPRCSVRIGADAERGWLAKIIEVQRAHSAAKYKYPRTTTAYSIPLAKRRKMNPFQGYPYHKPSRTSGEGDDVALLFRIMLHLMHEADFLHRIKPCIEFPIPRASQDSIHFHHVYWTKLVPPSYNWLGMPIRAREDRFYCFLYELFTTDPARRSMLPARDCTAVRNNACWPGFHLSDEELNVLVMDTFKAYVAGGAFF
jgi:hypothetical protein